VERDSPGVVCDDVFAVGQRFQCDGRTLVGNRGRDDYVDRGITEQARHILDPNPVRPARPNPLRHGRGGVLAALIEQALDLPESVCMVETDGGKPNWSTGLLCCAHWRSVLLKADALGLGSDRSITPAPRLEAAGGRGTRRGACGWWLCSLRSSLRWCWRWCCFSGRFSGD